MNRFDALKRWTWSIFVICLVAFSFAGCEGDDGAQGPQGPAGPAGPPGADGPPGSDAPPVAQVPLEGCGVCHSEDAFVSATAVHAKITQELGEVDAGDFANFAVGPDATIPADLTISFSVTADGAPALGATFYRAYFSDGLTRTTLTDRVTGDPGDPTAVPPVPPTPISAFFTNNGDGTYSLRLEGGVAEFGGTDGRYLVIVRTGANNLEIAAVGDYPNPIPLAGLVSDEACVGCHGASGEVGRFSPTRSGGHYSAPISAQQCVVCHRPDNPATPEDEEPSYMQFFRVVHGIHNSHEFPGDGFVTDRDNLYNITYPTYMSNCSVCHRDNIVPATGGTALAAANAMPVTARGCFSCHGSMESPDWDFSAPALDFHLNFVDPLLVNCQQCHTTPANGGFAPVTVADFHNYAGEDANGDPIGIVTERGGEIVDGVDTAVSEGAKFVWEITGVVDDGTNLAITWQASYDGVAVDPCNTTAAVGAPTFHASGDGNLSMLRNYAQGDDFILGQSTSAPGQATSVNVTVDNTVCAGNVATTTIPVDDVDAERGIVALQGKPRTLSLGDPSPTATQRVRAKTPTYEWVIGDGAAPLATRRDIVDTTGKCLNCHVGSLYQHGGNRVDNIGMCILCHNSASNEKNVRNFMGVDPSEAYDGKVGQSFEMKTMLHRIHSAGSPGSPPIVIYRGRGIYAFAPDRSGLPNWPGEGQQVVFGSDFADDDGTPGQYTTPHNFHSPDYPRALNACGACHSATFATASGTPVIPDQTVAMATTVDAGNEACAPGGVGCDWSDQLDDTLQGAATTACITCHTSGAAKGHAYQNSWTPQVFPDGRQTIIDAVK